MKKGLRTAVLIHVTNVDLNQLAAFSRVGQARDLQAFFDVKSISPAICGAKTCGLTY